MGAPGGTIAPLSPQVLLSITVDTYNVMALIKNFPVTDCISVWANLRLCVKTLRHFTHMKLEIEPCCVYLREGERKPGIISDRNGLMGHHSMRSWPRERHSEPISEHMSSIFQCGDKFTPLPLCPLSYYNCLSRLTGRSGHTLVEQLP